MLSGLEHIHSLAVIHRDIKPHNILISLAEPNKLRLIDFGIARHCTAGPPNQRNPETERRHIVGTLDWASLNSHYGVDLAPRDDLESLAYTLLFLLTGDLPWRPADTVRKDVIVGMKERRMCKENNSGKTLSPFAYPEFGQLLDYARSLRFEERPNYVYVRELFQSLATRCGFDKRRMLDWAPYDPPPMPSRAVQPQEDPPADVKEDSEDAGEDDIEEEEFSNSYFGMDFAEWDPQGERDPTLTLPADELEKVDSELPVITEIISEKVEFFM